MFRNSSSPADGDTLGRIIFKGNTSTADAGNNTIILGNASEAWKQLFVRTYKGYDGSSFNDGVTMNDLGGSPTTATFAVTDGSGSSVNLNLGVSGGIVALADMSPTGGGGGSDIKYKENVQDYSKGLSFLESLPSLSEYVQTIKSSEWKTIDDSVEDFKIVEYIKLERDILYSLVNSVKELSARVKELEAK
jgi:hypothetical protein